MKEFNGRASHYFCDYNNVRFKINCTKRLCDYMRDKIGNSNVYFNSTDVFNFIEETKKFYYINELVNENILELDEDLPLLEYAYKQRCSNE